MPNEGMTATEELRRLLDERGVEYHEYHSQVAGSMEPTTRFYLHDDEHRAYASIEVGCTNALLTLRCTPEQAVEATLGRGTCRRMPSDDATVMVKRGCFEVEFPFFECSECGSYVMDNARYCPICGARVVG